MVLPHNGWRWRQGEIMNPTEVFLLEITCEHHSLTTLFKKALSGLNPLRSSRQNH